MRKIALIIALILIATSKLVFATPLIQGFEVQTLHAEFIGENLGKSHFFGNARVIYLDDNSRNKYEITFKGGQAFDSHGQLFDTEGKPAIFVMLPNGRVFASKISIISIFHHSSLSSGQPVAMAGEIVVENGRLIKVNNRSGHYRPSDALLAQFVSRMHSLGIYPETEGFSGTDYFSIYSHMKINFKKINDSNLRDELLKNFIINQKIAPQSFIIFKTNKSCKEKLHELPLPKYENLNNIHF